MLKERNTLPGATAAAIFAGGCLGALARLGLAEGVPPDPGQWPWATFVANVAGAFLLGVVAHRFAREGGLGEPFLATGFCGALTTFSTLQIELLDMLDGGELALAAAYAAASLAAGLAAVALGQRC